MQLTVTTSHKLTFRVYTCWHEEGGMGEDSFGDYVDNIEEAIENLQAARNKQPKEDWFIECRVTTQVSGKQK